MTSRADLIHAAFKGLAEGLLASAGEPEPVQSAGRRNARRRPTSPVIRRRKGPRQMPLSPELESSLAQTFVPRDPRPPEEAPPPTVMDLDTMFRGGEVPESVQQLARQMQMQKAAAGNAPPEKPAEDAATSWGIPDR
jgi:hypothetical protein